MKKVAFYTLGCKVNQYETNAMAELFIKANYKIVDFKEQADIYIINTCTVTNIADRKSRQIIRRVKQIAPHAVLVVTGCYAQVAAKELEKIEEIDLIIGNAEKIDVVNIVENYCKNKNIENKTKVSNINNELEFADFGNTTYTEKTRAVVKIEDGCNNFCSYCIIPYAKGRVRSRNQENIVNEIKSIVNTGLQEVVITGIQIAKYGTDFKKTNVSLIDLLEDINKIKGLKRIRLSSLEPSIITDEFVTRLKKLDKICEHLHLSLQSGCDETLKRMNRKYSTEDFRNVVIRLRNAFPNVMLTTDVIVGFPGETEEEFEETYKYLKEMNFYKMHIFKYSQRKGTKAAVMDNQIDGNIKEKRSHKLIKLSNQNEQKFLNSYIGKTVEVLFEQKEGEYIKGHTSNYVEVKVAGKDLKNKILKVKILQRDGFELIGKLCHINVMQM